MTPVRRRGPGIVLASSSPRRRMLLRRLGVPFRCVDPAVDERVIPGETPAAHVRRLALAKARAVLGGALFGPVVGADTVVVIDGEILGKPRGAREAERMLRRLAGRTHEVLTGVAVLGRAPPRKRTAVVRSRVSMRPLEPGAIRAYVATGEPLDKAGSYAAQGRGRGLLAGIEGSLANVIGLPLERLGPMLEEFGVRIAPRPSRGAP